MEGWAEGQIFPSGRSCLCFPGFSSFPVPLSDSLIFHSPTSNLFLVPVVPKFSAFVCFPGEADILGFSGGRRTLSGSCDAQYADLRDWFQHAYSLGFRVRVPAAVVPGRQKGGRTSV